MLLFTALTLLFSKLVSKLTIAEMTDDWPNGNYSLPKPRSGCPETQGNVWKEGWIIQDLEDSSIHNSNFSLRFHMNATLTDRHGDKIIIRRFCTKENNSGKGKTWQKGSYCIYKGAGACPPEMVSGSIKWDDEDIGNSNDNGGSLPDGVYKPDTKINYCCQIEGEWYQPIELPTGMPFYLLPHGSTNCQRVKWAVSSLEYIVYNTEDYINNDIFIGSHVFSDQVKSLPKVFYCYYQGCHHKLRGYNGIFGSSNSSYSYPDFQYCSWTIEANSTLNVFLKFLYLGVPNCKENHIDIYDGTNDTSYLLVRFCGENATSGSSVVSYSNRLHIVFKSGNNSGNTTTGLGFAAQYEVHHGERTVQPHASVSTKTQTAINTTSEELNKFTTTARVTEKFTRENEELSSTQKPAKPDNPNDAAIAMMLSIIVPLMIFITVTPTAIICFRRRCWKRSDYPIMTQKINNIFVSGEESNNPVYEHGDAYETIAEFTNTCRQNNHNSVDNILYEHGDRDESIYSQPYYENPS